MKATTISYFIGGIGIVFMELSIAFVVVFLVLLLA